MFSASSSSASRQLSEVDAAAALVWSMRTLRSWRSLSQSTVSRGLVWVVKSLDLDDVPRRTPRIAWRRPVARTRQRPAPRSEKRYKKPKSRWILMEKQVTSLREWIEDSLDLDQLAILQGPVDQFMSQLKKDEDVLSGCVVTVSHCLQNHDWMIEHGWTVLNIRSWSFLQCDDNPVWKTSWYL